MVIGLEHGRTSTEDEEAKEKTYEVTREFMDKFKSENGSIICKELLEYDISTPEGMAVAEEKNLFETVCPDFVRSAVKILEQIL